MIMNQRINKQKELVSAQKTPQEHNNKDSNHLHYLSSGMQVQFSSVQDGICARKSLHAFHPVSQKFPRCRLSNGSNVPLGDNGPLSSFQGRQSSASSFHASLLQAISGVKSSALYLQVVAQATQHFQSSKKQATCEGCFACQSVCLVISLHSSDFFQIF